MKNISSTTMKVLGFYETNGADEAYFDENGLVIAIVDGKKMEAAHGWDTAFEKGKRIGLNNPDVHKGLKMMSQHYVEFGW